jgi:alkylation response protein AidB-like acyl-CoA dehydrogenase
MHFASAYISTRSRGSSKKNAFPPTRYTSASLARQPRFSAHPQIIEDMKKRAQELGLWNMFLPKAHFKEGAGFSNLEYGLMAEYLGKSRIASEVRMLAIVQAGRC